MAVRPIDASHFGEIMEQWKKDCLECDDQHGADVIADVILQLDDIPTLTPPNEWVNRVRELDELYTKLQIVTGFTAEQLLEIFAAGYTLEKPDYSKKFAEMENLAEAAQPNEPLTMEELRESPHGKIKNSTLQSICNRANEIASRPPEVSP